MVWLHGGGFFAGSGGSIRYDGTNLAKKHGVVLVTVNHRLGIFGFLNLASIGGPEYAQSGNAGMLDIVQALEWVRDNIAAFGGDPGNVTVFGESGGGSKVTTLMAMPAAQGLFHRAIAQSGLAVTHQTPEEATAAAQAALDKLGITADGLARLQDLPFEEILAAAPPPSFGPVVDGEVLPGHPFDPAAPALSKDVPLLLGSNLTETTFFGNTPLDPIDEATLVAKLAEYTKLEAPKVEELVALYRKNRPEADNTLLYQLISTDWWLGAEVALVAERKAAQGGAPAFVYRFEKTTPVRDGKLGSPHTLEIAYAFNNIDLSTAVTGTGEDKQALADAVSAAWTAFARTGDPSTPELPAWPPYTAEERAVMILDDEPKVVEAPNAEELAAVAALQSS
jgi:para-nitrobenzyl esterase